jgi:hypothetical protein
MLFPESSRKIHSRIELRAAALAAVILACTAYSSQTSEVPYVWAAFGLTAILSIAACITDRPWGRALWINLAVLTLTLGIGEVYFLAQEPLERQMEYSEGFFLADEVLGYKPAGGRTLSHRTSVQEKPLYQVDYAINEDGLRIAAPADAAMSSHETCLVFFGDSFTFGEGMTDERTMPYQAWKKLGGQLRTVNFGFLGYGPHQMLAAIQHGYLESRGHCRPSHVVYQAIPTHVSRAAGLETWDFHGPRYVLNAARGVRQDGHFDDVPRPALLDRLRTLHRQFPAQVKTTLEQSALYRMLLRSHRPVDAQDVALFGGIVGEARQLIETTYPGAQFHVLLWDYDDDQQVVEQVQQELAHRGVQVSAISGILPDFPAARARYEISQYDRHPNAMAHSLIADFVAHRLVNSGR